MAFDWRAIHTEPGHGVGQPLSPPEGFVGTGDQYLEWLRSGWTCPQRRQHIRCIARMMGNPAVYKRPQVCGPYARQALAVLERVGQ